MARFQYLNVEPSAKKKSDCVTRAITFASGLPYSTVRKKLYHTSRLLECESTYCNTCYGFFIQEVLGGVPTNCDGMTIGEFADLHPYGTYLIRIEGHLTTVLNGNSFDTFDCRDRYCDLAWKMHN
jgi:hypothetical protein